MLIKKESTEIWNENKNNEEMEREKVASEKLSKPKSFKEGILSLLCMNSMGF